MNLVLKVASMGSADLEHGAKGRSVVVASSTATLEAEACAALGAEVPVDELTNLDEYVAAAARAGPLVPRFVSAHALHDGDAAGAVWLGIVSERFGKSLHGILGPGSSEAWRRALAHDDVLRCIAWQLVDLVRALHARGYLHRAWRGRSGTGAAAAVTEGITPWQLSPRSTSAPAQATSNQPTSLSTSPRPAFRSSACAIWAA